MMSLSGQHVSGSRPSAARRFRRCVRPRKRRYRSPTESVRRSAAAAVAVAVHTSSAAEVQFRERSSEATRRNLASHRREKARRERSEEVEA